jgi:hypothetical protein
VCFTLSILTNSAQTQKAVLPYADSLFLAQNWKNAAAAYELVVKNGVVAPLTWNRLGFSYHNLSDYNKALENYEKALAAKPATPLEAIIQSRMARVYAVKNNADQAFIRLDNAIVLGYTNLTELETHKEFENVRTDKRYKEARNRVYTNVYPCMGNAQARQFDFWIGEWDAYVTGTNNLAGHSKIEMASGGCMILENWTSAGAPFSGKSMNFVDPVSGKWKQIWVGSNGINASEFLNGEYREDAMRFENETTTAQGVKTLVHFYFFNQNPDQMRQFHETSTDSGKTWVTTYDFTYKRRKA